LVLRCQSVGKIGDRGLSVYFHNELALREVPDGNLHTIQQYTIQMNHS
jgi:hypothetical protein